MNIHAPLLAWPSMPNQYHLAQFCLSWVMYMIPTRPRVSRTGVFCLPAAQAGVFCLPAAQAGVLVLPAATCRRGYCACLESRMWEKICLTRLGKRLTAFLIA